jgi:thioredoxin 1
MILTEKNFDQEVLKSDVLVVVDFWATWCMPCNMLSPVLEKLEKNFYGKIKVGKVNIDEVQKLAMEYDISAIPAIFIFKNGQCVQKSIGLKSYEELKALVEKIL